MLEVTALGAAALAGLAAGVWKDTSALASATAVARTFEPTLPEAEREALYRSWTRAVERSRDWADGS